MDVIKRRPALLSDMFTSNFGELMNEILGDDLGVSKEHKFKPAIEVYELEDGYTVEVALAGLTKEDVAIEIDGEHLKISGERRKSEKTDGDKLHLSEFRYGKFERKLQLPKNADHSKIDASLDNGVLKLSILKKEEFKPKQIEIK